MKGKACKYKHGCISMMTPASVKDDAWLAMGGDGRKTTLERIKMSVHAV